MKKIMIAAFVCALAGMVHAGAATWNALNIQASPDTADKSAATYCGYFFTGSDYTDVTKYLAIEASLDLDAFQAAAVGSATSTYVPASGMINLAGSSGAFTSESVTGYLIIVDGATVDAASNFLVAKVGGTGSEYITANFGTTGNQPFAFGMQAANTNWQAIAVPEPTSGLLLLLGMAGLALRRKQA